MTYIVWIGGIPDYEGNSLQEAKAIKYGWIAQGYDEVVLQVFNDKNELVSEG